MLRRQLGRAAFVSCALALLATVAAAEGGASQSLGPLPAEGIVLPPDVGLLAGLDTRGVFASKEYQGLLRGELPGMPIEEAERAQVREGIAKGLEEIEAKTGINLERDLDHAVVAVGGFGKKEPSIVLQVTGRFNAERIRAAFEATATGDKGFSKKQAHGRTLYVLSKGDQPRSILTFTEDGKMLFGTAPAVEAALASGAQGLGPAGPHASLLALVKTLDPNAGFWIVLGPSATAKIKERQGPQPPPFPIPESVTVAGRIAGSLEIVAEMPDAAAATSMGEMLKGGLAMLRAKLAQDLNTAKNPEVGAMFEAIQISAQGTQVRLVSPSGGATMAVIAAIAVPSMLRARVSANESAAIGDTRTIISAEAVYESTAGGYGNLACLGAPQTCIDGYTGPSLIDATLASGSDKSGYKRALHLGPPAERAGTYKAFAYTATPVQPGRTGVRSFCGDSSGRVCVDASGSQIEPVDGACPETCQDLN